MAGVGNSKKARRFFKDMEGINNTDGFEVIEHDERCQWMKVKFNGVPHTPYEGGRFIIRIELPSNFPFTAPTVYFENEMFHPNIGARGRVCMSILEHWKAGVKMHLVALGCRSLLDEGNAYSPLNGIAARMMDRHPILYEDTARYWTAVFANGPTRPQALHVKVFEALQCNYLRNEERALKVLTDNMWNVE